MFTTIVTPVNFNRFAKRLKNISHKYSLDISLSSAQDILSKTFGFKNQFELKKQFTNPDIHFVEINELKYQYYTERFSSFLKCDYEKGKSVFNEVFSLFKARNYSVSDIENSIISIINKITDIANNDKSMQKFVISYAYENINILVKKTNNDISLKDDEDALSLAMEKVESYPNLKLFWGGALRYNLKLFPKSIYLNEYFSLLDELFSYSKDSIINVLNDNKNIFVFSNNITYFIKFEHERIIFLDNKMYERNYYLFNISHSDKSQYKNHSLNNEYVITPYEILEKTLNNRITDNIKFNGNKNCIKPMHDSSLTILLSRANLIQNPNEFRIVEIFSDYPFTKQVNFDEAEHLLGKVYTIEEANSMIK